VLVAKTFLGYRNGDRIEFEDGDRSNISLENLKIYPRLNEEIRPDEVSDTTIDIRDPFSIHDLIDASPTLDIITREDILSAIRDLRRIVAAINSTPKVFIFKDFVKGAPHLAVGKSADVRSKYIAIPFSINVEYKTFYDVFTKFQHLILYDDVCFHDPNPTTFTFFRGYDIEPSDEYSDAVIAPFMEFTRDIICDGDQDVFDYLMGWLATILRHPETKLEVALVLLGETRTGKNKWAEFVSHLLGRYAVENITDMDHVVGKFNAVFEYKRFVVVNELESVAEAKRMNFDRLKTLITDKTASYNRKYGAMSQGDNTAHFVFISNNIVPLKITDADSMKFLITHVSSERRADHDFFGHLTNLMTPRVYQSLMRFFLDYLDENHFDPRVVPMTQAKDTIIEANLNPIEGFIEANYDRIVDITGPKLWEGFQKHCRAGRISITRWTKTLFLAEMKPYLTYSAKKIKGKTERVFNLSDEIKEQLAAYFETLHLSQEQAKNQHPDNEFLD
jgi:hypothetical protein